MFFRPRVPARFLSPRLRPASSRHLASPRFVGGRAAAVAGLALSSALLAPLGVPSAQAQRIVYQPVTVSAPTPLLHNRVASGDFNGDGIADLVLSGVQPVTGLPSVLLLRYVNDIQGVDSRGDSTFSVSYSSAANPFGAVWGGDVLAHDLDASGTADLVFTGSSDTTSTARPLSGAARQTGGMLAALAGFPVPPLVHARLAASGPLVAAMGRSATGALSLTLLRRSGGAGSTAYTTAATLPGLELGALAFGDCDRDGDADLFATGLDASGGPVATLYRNDGSTFAATALAAGVPGTFNGDAILRDLDGDGDADLALTGSLYGPFGTEGATRVYRADGCAFTPVALDPALAAFEGSGIAAGDLEGNGLDLIVGGIARPDGATPSGTLALVPLRGLSGVLAIGERLPGAAYGDVTVYDYDGDGRDDVLTTGLSNTPSRALLYRARFLR